MNFCTVDKHRQQKHLYPQNPRLLCRQSEGSTGYNQFSSSRKFAYSTQQNQSPTVNKTHPLECLLVSLLCMFIGLGGNDNLTSYTKCLIRAFFPEKL